MDRAGLAPGGNPRAQPGQQPAGQFTARRLEGGHHRGDHLVTGQHVARRHAVISRQGATDPESMFSAERRHFTVGINRRDLAIFAEAVLRQSQVQSLLNGGPRLKRAKNMRPQRR